jgi:FKBP-type peptidyl-prolyl cis-trans isomerase SlyD
MAESPARVRAGMVVGIRYTLRDDQGALVDQTGDAPERYLHGAGAIVPGLERALEGRAAGERFDATVPPALGFGARRRGPGAQAIPRATFPPDVRLEPGMSFEAQGVTLYVVRVERDRVLVDTNHPLAGRTLSYEGEVVDVRPATARERRQGRPDR